MTKQDKKVEKTREIINREEILNILINNSTDCITKVENPPIVSVMTQPQRTKAIDELIKHETDLLKQFVEYLKNKYTKSEKEQLEIIYNVYLKEDNRLKSNFHDGCRFGFELARTSMDQDLEKFLEERENG